MKDDPLGLDKDPLKLDKQQEIKGDPLGLDKDILGLDKKKEKKKKTTVLEDLKLGAASVANSTIGAVEAASQAFMSDPQDILLRQWQADDLRAKVKKTLGVDDDTIAGREQGLGGKLISSVPPIATAVVGGIPWILVQGIGSGKTTSDELKNELPPEDHYLANTVGLIEGAANTLSLAIPGMAGPGQGLKELAKTAIKTGTANVAQSYVTRGLQHRVLDPKYPELSKNYDPNNAENIAVDFIASAAPSVAVGAAKGLYERHATKQADKKLAVLKSNLNIEKTRAREQPIVDPEGLDQQRVLAPQYGGLMPNNDQESFNHPQRQPHQEPYMMNRYGGNDLPPGVVNPKALEAVNRRYGPSVNQPEMTVDQYDRYGTNLGKPGVVNHKALDRVVEGPTLSLFAEDGPSAAERMLAQTVNKQNTKLDKMKTGPFKIEEETAPPGTAQEIQQSRVARDVIGPEKLAEWGSPKTMEDAIELSRGDQDLPASKIVNNQLGSGPRMKAAVANNSIVKYVNKIVTDATLTAQKFVKDNVEPFAKTWSKMTLREQTEARTVAQFADQNQIALTPEQLKAAGYSDTVVTFLDQYRSALDNFHTAWNATKAENDLEEVKYRVGYTPASFKGDYTSVVTTKDGKIIAVIKANSRGEVKYAMKKAKELFPDAVVSRWDRRDMSPSGRGEFVQALADIQKLIGGDPRLAKISEALRAQGLEEASKLFNFDVHELNKNGVLGNEGNKFWKSATENNNDFFKAAVNYFEEGSINHNMVKPTSEIKALLGNKELLRDQQNTLKYLKTYQDYLSGKVNDVGDITNRAQDLVAKTVGRGPSAVRDINTKIINAAQHLWLGGFNVKVALAQMLQPIQTGLPMMMHAAKEMGYALPPVEASKALVKGQYLYITARIERGMGKEFSSIDPEFRAAYKYAEDRGLMSWSEYEHVREYGESRAMRGVSNASNALLRFAEGYTRPSVFFGLFDTLVRKGMAQSEALEKAFNMTQASMTDYHRNQKPMIYGSLGELGRQMGQLKTFTHSNVHLMRYFAGKDKSALTAMLTTQLAVAGIKGTIGMGLAAAVYNTITGDNLYDDMKNKMAEWAGFTAESKEIDRAMYGVLSEGTGVWLQSSLSSGDILPHDSRSLGSFIMPSGAGLVAKTAKNLYDFYKYPDTLSANNVVKDLLPSSVKGAWDIETRMTRDRLINRNGHPMEPALTEEDKWLHKYGLGMDTYNFGKNRAQKFENNDEEAAREAKAKDLATSMTRSLVRGEFSRQQLLTGIGEYTKLTQSAEKTRQLLQQIPRKKLETLLSAEELLIITGKPAAAAKYLRLQEGTNDRQK